MSARKGTPSIVVDSYKNVHSITRNLQTVLSINSENATEKDVNEILNLTLPIKQIDNLIKITVHTNENLEKTKSNLLKNRNLMAEEISCLNEFFDETNVTENEIEVKNSAPKTSQSEEQQKLKSDEEGKHSEDDLSKDNVSYEEYKTRKLLEEQKKKKKEVLLTPPMLDLTKLK